MTRGVGAKNNGKEAATQVAVHSSHKCGSWEISSVDIPFLDTITKGLHASCPLAHEMVGNTFHLYCIPLSSLLFKSLIGVTVLRQTQESKTRCELLQAEITEHERNSS